MLTCASASLMTGSAPDARSCPGLQENYSNAAAINVIRGISLFIVIVIYVKFFKYSK